MNISTGEILLFVLGSILAQVIYVGIAKFPIVSKKQRLFWIEWTIAAEGAAIAIILPPLFIIGMALLVLGLFFAFYTNFEKSFIPLPFLNDLE